MKNTYHQKPLSTRYPLKCIGYFFYGRSFFDGTNYRNIEVGHFSSGAPVWFLLLKNDPGYAGSFFYGTPAGIIFVVGLLMRVTFLVCIPISLTLLLHHFYVGVLIRVCCPKRPSSPFTIFVSTHKWCLVILKYRPNYFCLKMLILLHFDKKIKQKPTQMIRQHVICSKCIRKEITVRRPLIKYH